MSGYNYSYSEQSSCPSNFTQYPTTPQYTQSQINHYYAQYQCCPPQPFQIIPDCYTQPASITQNSYQPTAGSQLEYDHGRWQVETSQYNSMSQTAFQDRPRSNSQTRYVRNDASPPLATRNSYPGRIWTCDISGCTSNAQFTRLADLQRHQATVHGVGRPEFPCNVPRCSRIGDKGFTRRDHLIEHLRSFHHLDIPKRRPGERSAFPFGWPEGYQS